MSKYENLHAPSTAGLEIAIAGTNVDHGRVSEKAKEKYRRPAYQYTVGERRVNERERIPPTNTDDQQEHINS